MTKQGKYDFLRDHHLMTFSEISKKILDKFFEEWYRIKKF